MFVGSLFQHPEQFLEQRPSTPRVDHVLVLLQRGGAELGPPWLGTAQVFLREQTAKEGAIGKQRNSVVAAERSHPDLGPAIDERILDLVRDDANMAGYHVQALGIEIGQPEVTDFAFVLEVCEMLERVEIARVLIIPPMELEQV